MKAPWLINRWTATGRPRHVRLAAAPSARRGVIAFTALVMLSVLAIVTLAASEEMMLEAKAARNRNAIRQAYLAAYTGIDYCLYLTALYPDWRTRCGSGDWIANYAVGSGKVTVAAADPDDGQVSGDPLGVIQFTASSACGLAKRIVTAQGRPVPGQAIKYVLCALSANDLELRQGVSVYGDIRTRGKVVADSNVALAGNIYTASGKDVTSTLLDADTQVIRTDRVVPTPPVDFAWYRSVAQELTLPLSGGHYDIDSVLLTPTNNPFGLTHSQGLYYINGRGLEVRVRNSSIVGTLIIENASQLWVRSSCVHRPFSRSYPAIVSTCNVLVEIESYLSESTAHADFNGDTDTQDTFVSRIDGLIYSAGTFTGFQINANPGPFYFSGAVIANQIRITAGQSFHVSYDRNLAAAAVAGFQAPGLALVQASLSE
ncbi:MAG TPA: hypothetical protein VM223_10370 [Planctomycetota bacterium]|nr:hypothetical protein [Planctomycetota bacterium]